MEIVLLRRGEVGIVSTLENVEPELPLDSVSLDFSRYGKCTNQTVEFMIGANSGCISTSLNNS